MDLKIFIGLTCMYTVVLAGRDINGYFNSTAHGMFKTKSYFNSTVHNIFSFFNNTARYIFSYFNRTANALRVYGHSYYNPMTGEALEGQIDDTERLPFSSPKISFKGLPCACVGDDCGCCAGLNISAIKLNRRYCANFTVDPSKLTIDLKVMMNENEVFQTSISARNPPPVCVPLPYIPVLDFCLRFYDLSLETGNNLQTCIDFETRLATSPLLVMHFNCVRVGASGISWVKPGTTANQTVNPMNFSLGAGNTEQQQATDVYDPVNFENADDDFNESIVLNATTLSPEDEDKIGSHRIT